MIAQGRKSEGKSARTRSYAPSTWRPTARLSNNRLFATMHSAEDGVPDGMKVDVEGRVYCTGPGGCWVFRQRGQQSGYHSPAGDTGQLCLGWGRQPDDALHCPHLRLFGAHDHTGHRHPDGIEAGHEARLTRLSPEPSPSGERELL